MPLIKYPTRAARQRNVDIEIAAGKPPRQAVAISYAEQRRARERKNGLAAALRGKR